MSLTKGLNIGVCLNSCCPALAEPCCKGWALRACQQISASLPSAPGASQSRDGKVSEQGRGEGGGSWGAEEEERFCVHLLQGHEVIFPFFLSLDTTRTRTHMLMLFPPMKEVVGAIYKSLHETFSAKETCPSKCYARLMPTAQELLRGVYDI